MPWSDQFALLVHYQPEGGRYGQHPFAPETILCIYFLQQWFRLSDSPIEEPLHDVPLFRDFEGLSSCEDAVPSKTSILRFHHRLKTNKLPRPNSGRGQ